MRASGLKKALKMVKGSKSRQMALFMKVTGAWTKLMATDARSMQMVLCTLAGGRMATSMGLAKKLYPASTLIWVILNWANVMVRAKSSGTLGQATRGNLRIRYVTVQVLIEQRTAPSTLENGATTNRMVTVL